MPDPLKMASSRKVLETELGWVVTHMSPPPLPPKPDDPIGQGTEQNRTLILVYLCLILKSHVLWFSAVGARWCPWWAHKHPKAAGHYHP